MNLQASFQAVELATPAGPLPARLFRPDGHGPFPAVALGMEAMGLNRFMQQVCQCLAEAGFMVLMPDYYRGGGPSEPDNYEDFSEVVACIDALDFRQGVFDLLAAVDFLRDHSDVDATRVATWGYCTGGTFALMAAALDRDLVAAVLFFPSQLVFDQLNARKPIHSIDSLWSVRCPLCLIAGDQDPVIPASTVDTFKQRCTQWRIDHEVHIYAGANHAFSSPSRALYRAEADIDSWAKATSFLQRSVA